MGRRFELHLRIHLEPIVTQSPPIPAMYKGNQLIYIHFILKSSGTYDFRYIVSGWEVKWNIWKTFILHDLSFYVVYHNCTQNKLGEICAKKIIKVQKSLQLGLIIAQHFATLNDIKIKLKSKNFLDLPNCWHWKLLVNKFPMITTIRFHTVTSLSFKNTT